MIYSEREVKPPTKYELAWHEAISSGKVNAAYDRLQEMRALPLREKIDFTEHNIIEWYRAFDGQVSVSFSGGIDSTVLLYLIRRIYPKVPAVFVNTGLEYPEIVRLVKSTPNTEIIRPKIPFHHVIQKYGWPVVSKKVARGISILRHPTEKNQNVYGLYDRGVNRFGKKVNGFKVAERWRFLIDAPFPVSDHCCQVMKKNPIHLYERQTKRVQYVGLMAEDSKNREKVYLQHGCNAFDLKTPHSTPLGFWTKQDILECIATHKIPYASVYGEIRRNQVGFWECAGVQGTGCVFCCFGLHMETGDENRFQRLHRTHPHLWKYCMEKLGLKDVLSFMESNVPRFMKERFNPNPQPKQMKMWTN
jgi:3'-phosphoadenosine 5'-phosphosulfate sulfotransferase (PAPS reductase)/FAD synthetase